MTRLNTGLRRWLILGLALIMGNALAAFAYTQFIAPQDTAHIGSLTVTQVRAATAAPAIDEATARRSALSKLHELRPDVDRFTVAHATHISGVLQVEDSSGNVVFGSNRPTDAWVIELVAPGQQGFRFVSGDVIIDAQSGEIQAASVLMTNK